MGLCAEEVGASQNSNLGPLYNYLTRQAICDIVGRVMMRLTMVGCSSVVNISGRDVIIHQSIRRPKVGQLLYYRAVGSPLDGFATSCGAFRENFY